MFMRNEKQINGRTRGRGEGEKEGERSKRNKEWASQPHAYVAFAEL